MAVLAEEPEQSVSALAARDEAALRQAYLAHHPQVRAFARRLVGDDASAEDLVHDVFVHLPRAARRFRGDATLGTFLIGIAINLARHHVRAAARKRKALERYYQEHDAHLASREEVSERRELADVLLRALDRLPIDQRVAFVLCEVEDRSSAEAAAIAGTSDGTLRARLFHAKKKLRAELSAWAPGGRQP